MSSSKFTAYPRTHPIPRKATARRIQGPNEFAPLEHLGARIECARRVPERPRACLLAMVTVSLPCTTSISFDSRLFASWMLGGHDWASIDLAWLSSARHCGVGASAGRLPRRSAETRASKPKHPRVAEQPHPAAVFRPFPGAHECCTVKKTRARCGITDVTRPSALHSPARPKAEPFGRKDISPSAGRVIDVLQRHQLPLDQALRAVAWIELGPAFAVRHHDGQH